MSKTPTMDRIRDTLGDALTGFQMPGPPEAELWDAFRLYSATDLEAMRSRLDKQASEHLKHLAANEAWIRDLAEERQNPHAEDDMTALLKEEMLVAKPLWIEKGVTALCMGRLLDYRIEKRLAPDEYPDPFAQLPAGERREEEAAQQEDRDRILHLMTDRKVADARRNAKMQDDFRAGRRDGRPSGVLIHELAERENVEYKTAEGIIYKRPSKK